MDTTSTSSHQHRDVFVLSGGASRGAVQVGMMQTLVEAGVVPDGLVGSSVGALNAAFMGWEPGTDRDTDRRFGAGAGERKRRGSAHAAGPAWASRPCTRGRYCPAARPPGPAVRTSILPEAATDS